MFFWISGETFRASGETFGVSGETFGVSLVISSKDALTILVAIFTVFGIDALAILVLHIFSNHLLLCVESSFITATDRVSLETLATNTSSVLVDFLFLN